MRAVLTDRAGGGWVLTPPDQRRLEFDAQGGCCPSRTRAATASRSPTTVDGLLTTVTDAAGRVVRIEKRATCGRSARSRCPTAAACSSTTSPAASQGPGRAQPTRGSYHYDAAGRLDKVTDARGKRDVANAYDDAGRVARADRRGRGRERRSRGTRPSRSRRRPTRTASSRVDGYRDNVLLWSRNGNGDTVTYRYDEKPQRVARRRPRGQPGRRVHDAERQPGRAQSPRRRSTTWSATRSTRATT